MGQVRRFALQAVPISVKLPSELQIICVLLQQGGTMFASIHAATIAASIVSHLVVWHPLAASAAPNKKLQLMTTITFKGVNNLDFIFDFSLQLMK